MDINEGATMPVVEYEECVDQRSEPLPPHVLRQQPLSRHNEDRNINCRVRFTFNTGARKPTTQEFGLATLV